MNHIVKLPGDVEARLQAHAQAQGLSPDSYLAQLVERALPADNPPSAPKLPRRSAWGVLAHLGPPPSEEEIREVRREMWRNFPRDID
jgi:hypothetical protein